MYCCFHVGFAKQSNKRLLTNIIPLHFTNVSLKRQQTCKSYLKSDEPKRAILHLGAI